MGNVRNLKVGVPGQQVDFSLAFDENTFMASPRVWLGYGFSNGTSIRGRWWQFDHALQAEHNEHHLGVAGADVLRWEGTGRLRLYTVDVDVVQQLETRIVEANVGVGIRFAGIEHNRDLNVTIPHIVDIKRIGGHSFEGLGPCVSAEIYRSILNTNARAFIASRGSLLIGRRENSCVLDADIPVLAEYLQDLTAVDASLSRDAQVFASELRLGAEWFKDLSGRARFFVRGSWDTQFWAGSGVGLFGISLMGGSIGMGIAR